MVEADDLSDIGSFLSGITGDILNSYKTFNAPGGLPVPAAPASPRPDQAAGPRSTPASTGLSPSTISYILLGGAVVFLSGAFLLSVRR